MDVAGSARIRRSLMSLRLSLGLLLTLVSSCSAQAQTAFSDHEHIAEARRLLEEERWEEVVRLAEGVQRRSPDLDYYYGIALARLERWDGAQSAFQRGRAQRPRDKRFPIELAGVSFKQQRFPQAADHLRDALRLDPADPYANDFLAGVYFLLGNLEAALKYWNRVNKPDVVDVRSEPAPKVDPVLLDRAFAFAPASLLRLEEHQKTDARVRGLDIFASHRFDLQARMDGKFDMVFRASERVGLGNTTWQGLPSLLRGVPFQTVHPEVFNIRRRAVNFMSMVRWDRDKQRLWANLSGPYSGDPKRRYGFDLDARRENWDLRDSFSDRSQSFGGFRLHKQRLAAEVTSIESGRLNWTTGFEVSHRRYGEVTAGIPPTPELLLRGWQLKQLGLLNYDLVRMPEKRFIVTTGASTEVGRIWSDPSRAFAKLQFSIQTGWFPQSQGDDYETRLKVRGGKTFGTIPFDELFILGVERDNDLWLRAHVGTHEGRKGSAPLGRGYFLANWEIDKNVYGNGLVSVKLGPFLDGGKVTDVIGPGSREWLWDVGLQAKVRVLGVGVAFSYGKDLRSGSNAFYVSTSR